METDMAVQKNESSKSFDLRNSGWHPRHRFEASPTFEMELQRNNISSVDDSTEITDEEAGELAPAVVNLFGNWKLSDEQALTLLGGLSSYSWDNWKKGIFGTTVLRRRDLRMRMAHLIGIHYGLRKRFSDREQGYEWIKQPNEAFDGKSALEVMLYGEMNDLAYIREWVNMDIGMG